MAVRAVDARAQRSAATAAARHPREPAANLLVAAPGAPVRVVVDPGVVAPEHLATVTPLRPVSRAEALAAARRERRRWLVLSAVVFATPFAACLGVLEVVR